MADVFKFWTHVFRMIVLVLGERDEEREWGGSSGSALYAPRTR